MRLPVRFILLIPFYPLLQFIRTWRTYGTPGNAHWGALPIWIVKCVLIEPMRLFEALVMAFLPERKVDPVFILGFYRSGTTYLQELLTANRSHRTLTLFQSVLPEISLCFGWLFEPIFSFTAKVLGVENEFHNIPLDGRSPGEDDVAINALSAFHDYNKIYQFPSHDAAITDNYLKFHSGRKARRWREYHQYLTQKLAYIYPGKRLILKSPPNTARMEVLKEIYPNAQFVFISRQPTDVIQSAMRLWHIGRKYSFEKYGDDRAQAIILGQYLDFHERYLEQRCKINCCDIRFTELVRDPMTTMAKIYAELNLSNWEEAKRAIMKIAALRKKPAIKTYEPRPSFIGTYSDRLADVSKRLGYEELTSV